MSHRGDIAKLVKTLKYIANIEKIIIRHQGSMNALKDFEGQGALLMSLMQIGELLNQLHDAELVEKLQVRKIVAFRNIIAHEYEAVLLDKTNSILVDNIPHLKSQILQYLKLEPDFTEIQKLLIEP